MGLSRFLNVQTGNSDKSVRTLVTECLARFATIYAELDLVRRDARLVEFSKTPELPNKS
jgi:hypothetical protein